ncbi:MAG TPA: protein phosphatase 2C domain-containing protein [Opitutales bacterium]|jgi:serine/threonine protein phosphatase PrpC|nr:protein phosphatase 2C domain-containing protein [Opitutales bacterium]
MADTPTVSFKAFGQSDCGLMREHNEDAFLALPRHAFFAVADGLGGLPEGSLASTLAVECLQKWFEAPGRNGKLDLRNLFNLANQRVHDEGRLVSEDVGIGTTLTAFRLLRGQIEVGHVGDSGLYLFRHGEPAKKLTTDHTMAEEMRARLRPGDNMYIPDYYTHTLTRCIGQAGDIEVDTFTAPVKAGDRLLLYTDGVTKVFHEEELNFEVLSSESPEKLVARLVKLGNDRGGPDNLTAIAIYL